MGFVSGRVDGWTRLQIDEGTKGRGDKLTSGQEDGVDEGTRGRGDKLTRGRSEQDDEETRERS